MPFWRTAADDAPAPAPKPRARQSRRAMAERDRLLYVAMTRAESWLIVAAAGDLGKTATPGTTPSRRADRAGRRRGTPGRRRPAPAGGDWPARGPAGRPGRRPPRRYPPVWVAPAPTRIPRRPRSAPSDLGGAKALPGEAGLDEAAAKRRGYGRFTACSNTCPPARRLDRVAIAAALPGPMTGRRRRSALLLAEAAGARQTRAGALFAAGALAEVPVDRRPGPAADAASTARSTG